MKKLSLLLFSLCIIAIITGCGRNTGANKIEKTAKQILEVRKKYKDSSLAELYDEITMPIELREAHRENDKAVMEAYGFRGQKMKESECVRRLMELYKKIIDKE